MVDEVRRVARERFGISRLHREQERAILTVLGGKDTLLILPTGGGKSLCYQLPSLLMDRPTVVVSPLLALLEDQHQKLVHYGVPAIRLDSTVGAVERREALARLKDGGSLLVLTTPETLAGKDLGGLLEKNPPGLIAVDEAHCISEWGHDFRPAYLALGQRVAALQAGQVLALTATATAPVRDDIIRYLGLRDPEIIVASPHRHNLVFEVRHVRGDEKLRQLAKLARRLPRPGIIYCSTTKAVEDVWLGLRLIKIPTARYHGKMTDKDRTSVRRFMRKGKRIVGSRRARSGSASTNPTSPHRHYQAPACRGYLQGSRPRRRADTRRVCPAVRRNVCCRSTCCLPRLARACRCSAGAWRRRRGARRQHRGARAHRHRAADVDRDGARRSRDPKRRRPHQRRRPQTLVECAGAQRPPRSRSVRTSAGCARSRVCERDRMPEPDAAAGDLDPRPCGRHDLI
jgi:hypothetical protein